MKDSLSMPIINVSVNGSQLPGPLEQRITSVRVAEKLSLPAQCEIGFIGIGDELSEYGPGLSLEVTLHKNQVTLFDGHVTAVEHVYGPSGRREARIRGYDRLFKLRKRQPVKAHVQVTCLDLVRELTGDLGIAVDGENPGPFWPKVIQCGQTDFDLLVELSHLCGLYFTLCENTLHVVTLEGMGDPVPLKLGETLVEARTELNLLNGCESVTALGWDPLLVTSHRGEVKNPRVGRKVSAKKMGSAENNNDGRFLVDALSGSDDHAAALAQAELDVQEMNRITLWGIAKGNPLLHPAIKVDVSHVDARFSGEYVLTEVTHTIDNIKGFVSEISTVIPTPRPKAKSTTAALGKVTSMDDPEKLGRVKVSLPAFNDVETDWMGVITAAAGKDKGLIALPDVGDLVVVLCPRGDPAHGLVAGGLYGSQPPPDDGLEDGAIKRYTFLSPGGQKIQLNDSEKTIRLENSDNSYIDITPEKVVIHSERDLDIQAPGKKVSIMGSKIDFKRK